jgi:hypothetical protein
VEGRKVQLQLQEQVLIGPIKRQLFWPVRVNYFGRFLSSAKARCLAVC